MKHARFFVSALFPLPQVHFAVYRSNSFSELGLFCAILKLIKVCFSLDNFVLLHQPSQKVSHIQEQQDSDSTTWATSFLQWQKQYALLLYPHVHFILHRQASLNSKSLIYCIFLPDYGMWGALQNEYKDCV